MACSTWRVTTTVSAPGSLFTWTNTAGRPSYSAAPTGGSTPDTTSATSPTVTRDGRREAVSVATVRDRLSDHADAGTVADLDDIAVLFSVLTASSSRSRASLWTSSRALAVSVKPAPAKDWLDRTALTRSAMSTPR